MPRRETEQDLKGVVSCCSIFLVFIPVYGTFTFFTVVFWGSYVFYPLMSWMFGDFYIIRPDGGVSGRDLGLFLILTAVVILAVVISHLLAHVSISGVVRWIAMAYFGFGTWIVDRYNRRREARLGDLELSAPPVPAEIPQAWPCYPYEPLPSEHHIRVLALHPGVGSALTCSLETVDIDDDDELPFEAVSYRWMGETCSVICDGRRISLQQNAFDLLTRLREPHRIRYLWVDALCINQGDDREKQSQIALMGRVYTRCIRCVVWLGWHSREDALAFRLLSSVNNVINDGQPSGLLEPGTTTDSRWGTHTRQWIALSRLLANPWFERLWTFQEAILPSDALLVRGKFEIPGDVFYRIMNYIGHEQLLQYLTDEATGYHLLTVVIRMRDSLHALRQDKGSVLDVLRVAGERVSTDPRDRIFGIAALVAEDEFRSLQLDYTSPVLRMYHSLAITLLRQEKPPVQSLLITASSLSPARVSDLPSWSPNWEGRLALTDEQHAFEAHPTFSAGGLGEPFARVLETDFIDSSSRIGGPTVLLLRGRHITDLAWFIDYDSTEFREDYENEYLRYVSIKRQLWKLGRILTGFYRRPRPRYHFVNKIQQHIKKHQHLLPQMYHATRFLQDAWGYGLRRRSDMFLEHLCRCEGALSKLERGDYDREGGSKWILNDGYSTWEASGEVAAEWFDSWIGTMKFCHYGNNSVGWVPKAAMEGDAVFAIRGCSLPFVLRPVPGQEDFFTLVGYCYIFGFMQGQAMEDSSLSTSDIFLI